jgi:hypothetical protein
MVLAIDDEAVLVVRPATLGTVRADANYEFCHECDGDNKKPDRVRALRLDEDPMIF